jgi:hypothetical protein
MAHMILLITQRGIFAVQRLEMHFGFTLGKHVTTTRLV